MTLLLVRRNRVARNNLLLPIFFASLTIRKQQLILRPRSVPQGRLEQRVAALESQVEDRSTWQFRGFATWGYRDILQRVYRDMSVYVSSKRVFLGGGFQF